MLDQVMDDALHRQDSHRPLVDHYEGRATVATYSVVHGRGGPEWGLVVCDVPGSGGNGRCYGRVEAGDLLTDASTNEWVGRSVTLAPHPTRAGVNMVTA